MKALEFDPENIGAWHNMALCKIKQGDYSGAKNDLDRLITISPRYTKAYLMRGEVDLKQKDTIAAEKDFGACHRDRPLRSGYMGEPCDSQTSATEI